MYFTKLNYSYEFVSLTTFLIIIMFLDVSVIMPFYKRFDSFKRIFVHNRKYFIGEGLEIVIVLDCLQEKDELLEFIKEKPEIKWRLIWNENEHEWRNPSKPLNVGIKNSSFNYIMVCSPESMFCSNAILQFRTTLELYPNHYCIGQVAFGEGSDEKFDNKSILDWYPYGSVMVKKSDLFAIHGYDETLNKWGGDDDNLRARLELLGVKKLFLPEVRLIHYDINNPRGKLRRASKTPLDLLRKFHYPTKLRENRIWGEDFDNIIYDWRVMGVVENNL